MIAAGRVAAHGGIVTRAALELARDTPLTVTADPNDRFVSRGGVKLAGSLAITRLDVAGRSCLDVGQSTGGFTDCLLQADARLCTNEIFGAGLMRYFGIWREKVVLGGTECEIYLRRAKIRNGPKSARCLWRETAF